MLIRDLECKTGLDRATIRFYEKEGLIMAQRKENGYREYTEDSLNHLLKIKLLRQLGMSLDTIKRIQQGSADFSQALSAQICNLENVMQIAARAKDVCAELYQKNANYATLDPVYYLEQLNNQDSKVTTSNFREYVERPYHPIRRFLARMTDYAILRIFLEFVIVVILRVRPYDQFLSGIISYGTPFLMVPISAFMLHKWGTTPGKWLYGLNVLSENGCKLSYSDSKDREWQVLMEGYGFGIPVLSVWRLYKSYSAYQEWEPEWDKFCEYQFRSWSNRSKCILVISIAALVMINTVTLSDAIKPKHRGDITIQEFAENYNYYSNLINNQPVAGPEMRSDGTWYPESGDQVTIHIDGLPKEPKQNFEFQTNNMFVRSIRYKNSWTDIFLFSPVSGQCEIAAVTTALSQKGIGLFDLPDFLKEIDSADMLSDGEIICRNIIIRWDIETENCTIVNGGYFVTADESKPSYVGVEFEIIIK